MATATINGITVEMTVAELMELANCQTVSTQIVEKAVARKSATPKASTSAETGRFTVEANCGHTVTRNSPRGRKPNLCNDCKGITNSESDEAKVESLLNEQGLTMHAEKVGQPRQGNSEPKNGQRRGYRRNNRQNGGDDWKQEPMSDKQRDRILGKLEISVIQASERKSILRQLDKDPRMTGGEASKLWQKVRNLPTHKS